MKLQHGSLLSVKSSWKQIPEKTSFEMVGSSFHIGDLSFQLPKGPALLAHTQLVSKEQNVPLENLLLIDKTNQSSRKAKSRVYMVTRHDGVEVFLES